MPRKLRQEKRRTRLTLDDLGFEELLCFLSGWHPPETEFGREQSRWETWAQFDGEYELLRDEVLAHEWAQKSLARGKAIFAEERFLAARHGGIR